MRSPATGPVHLLGTWLATAAAAGIAGCLDSDPVTGAEDAEPHGIVSNPVASVAGIAGSAALVSSGNVVYVSLPPDSVPNGEIAVVRNTRTGGTVSTAMADGGFDPVPVTATAGDALELDVQVSGGGAAVHMELVVPEHRKPRVVRTRPVARKRDVVLNARPVVVFTEPIREGTVNSTSVQLLRGGAPVSGRAVVTVGGLRAEFVPDQLLAPNTEYVLSVTTGVEDLSGDALAQTVEVAFTAGTTTAVAAVYTDPAALYVVKGYPALDGLLRTAEFNAVLHDDGRVTGHYSLFFPERGWRSSGSLTCFSIAGDTAWVAGVVEEATKTDMIGKDLAWLAVDNGLPGSGVPDQLSLAWVGLASGGFGNAEDFCDNQPTETSEAGKLLLQDVEVGDIVVTGTTPPPPPPPVPSGQIAFAGVLDGDPDLEPSEIYVINPDGSEARRLTYNQAGEGGPAWSPDGTRIAFAKSPENDPSDIFFRRTDIYVMNADGSGIIQLTHDEQGNRDPAWSPDGKRVVFTRGGYGAPGEIYLMNADGSGVTRLTNNPGNDETPMWSPAGARIAFASQRNGVDYQIYVMNADGSGLTRLTYGPEQDLWPRWSPDGRKMAFGRGGESGGLFVMNADGSGARRITADYGNGFPSAWSPDGAMIAFLCAGDDPNRSYICEMTARGSGLMKAFSASALASGPAWAPGAAVVAPSVTVEGMRR